MKKHIIIMAVLIGVLFVGVSPALAADLQGTWDAYWLWDADDPETLGHATWTIEQDGNFITVDTSTPNVPNANGFTKGRSVVFTFRFDDIKIRGGAIVKTGISFTDNSMGGIAVAHDGSENGWFARRISKGIGHRK